MKIRILAMLAITLSLTPLVSQAEQIYRWVDDEGTTHFTSHPPKGRQSEALRTHTGHSEPVDYSSQYPARTEADNPETQAAAGESRQASQQELDEACERARQNLEVLERGGRIATQAEDGSNRYLDEEELAERAETARQIRDKAC